MANTSSPVVAGVLSIVSGVVGFFSSVGLVLFSVFFGNIESFPGNVPNDFPAEFLFAVCLVCGIILLVLTVVAVIGGIFALQRRLWGLALAGAIVSIITFFPAGIAAVVFVAISKEEFQ